MQEKNIYKQLCVAIQEGDLGFVKDCLENKKIQIDDAINTDKYTMLQQAARYEQLEIIQYLLDKGANVLAKNIRGRTAFDTAWSVFTANYHNHMGHVRHVRRAAIVATFIKFAVNNLSDKDFEIFLSKDCASSNISVKNYTASFLKGKLKMVRNCKLFVEIFGLDMKEWFAFMDPETDININININALVLTLLENSQNNGLEAFKILFEKDDNYVVNKIKNKLTEEQVKELVECVKNSKIVGCVEAAEFLLKVISKNKNIVSDVNSLEFEDKKMKLINAIKEDDEELFRNLVVLFNFNINPTIDTNANTLLHYAARFNSLKVASYLIAKGANVDALNIIFQNADFEDKKQLIVQKTPYNIACERGNNDFAEYLFYVGVIAKPL